MAVIFTKNKLSLTMSLLILSLLASGLTSAQTTITTAPSFSNNNGTGLVTFNFQNTNTYPVTITAISSVMRVTGAATFKFWYKTTAVNGLPGTIDAANGWTLVSTAPYSSTIGSTTNQTLEPVLPGLSFVVPANTTYGFCVSGFLTSSTGGAQGYYSMPATPANVTFSAGGCNILTGANISYASTSETGSATFTPRGFVGSITFTGSAATCPAPTALTAAPSATTASLDWTQTGTASQWQLKYGAPGFSPATAGTAIVTSTKPYTLNPPLTALTSYDYYVRAICGPGDTSAWSAVKSFTTLCAAPSLLSTKDSNRCGPGDVVLQATAPANATIKWYGSATGGTPLGTGGSFTAAGLTNTTTFYAAAASGSGGITNGSLATITGGINGCSGGIMFNITPTVDIVVDSFLNLSNTAQTTTVTVYYKTGTYVGAEATPAAWTTLGTTTVTTSSTMTLIKVIGASIPMTAGTTYGIFIANMGTGYTDGNASNMVYSNADLTLNAGAGLCGVFTSTVNSPRVFNGTVFYHKGSSCESSPRTAVTATVKAMPTVNLGNDTTICPGITYTLNAANSGSTFSWNTGASTQSITAGAAGNYSVLVTAANGCSNSDAIVITPGIVPVNNLPGTTNLCAGDVATLNAGNTGSTFLWTPGNATTQTINVSNPGTYSVVVKSSTGCKITSNTNLIIRPLPVPHLGNDTSICDGDQITLDAGNAGYTFDWNTGASTQTIIAGDSGTYTVTVTSPYNCTLQEDKHIAFLPSPRVEGFNFIPLFYEELGKVKFSPLNPTNVNTYEWDFGDGSPLSTQVNPEHHYTSGGNYIVTLKVFNGCGNFEISLPINVNLTTGIVTLNGAATDMVLYPNPATDFVTIDNKTAGLKMEEIIVYNAIGAAIYKHKADSAAKHQLSVSGLSSGIYSLRVLTNKGWVVRKFEIIR